MMVHFILFLQHSENGVKMCWGQ